MAQLPYLLNSSDPESFARNTQDMADLLEMADEALSQDDVQDLCTRERFLIGRIGGGERGNFVRFCATSLAAQSPEFTKWARMLIDRGLGSDENRRFYLAECYADCQRMQRLADDSGHIVPFFEEIDCEDRVVPLGELRAKFSPSGELETTSAQEGLIDQLMRTEQGVILDFFVNAPPRGRFAEALLRPVAGSEGAGGPASNLLRFALQRHGEDSPEYQCVKNLFSTISEEMRETTWSDAVAEVEGLDR
jgi:hypothetical protein